MGLFSTARNHPIAVGGACIVVLLVVVPVIYFLRTQNADALPPPPAPRFFIDERTGEEHLLSTELVAPLPATDGQPALVEAVFYSCDAGKTRKLAYLVKYTPELKQVFDQYAGKHAEIPPELTENLTANTLYRSPQPNSPWLPGNDPAVTAIVKLPAKCPDGSTPKLITPTKDIPLAQ